MNLYTTASSIECHRTRIVLNEKDIVHEVILDNIFFVKNDTGTMTLN